MFVANAMSRIAEIVPAFDEDDKIVVVGVVDRFTSKPAASGWRDLIIRFYFSDDTNKVIHVYFHQKTMQRLKRH